jgi:uncharacterized membrane protein YagU involved in acid resistance
MREGRAFDLLFGAIAGLVSGVLLAPLGLLANMAQLIGVDSPLAGLVAYHVIAVLFGVGFALLLPKRRLGSGESLLWGLAYGALWWLLNPLTLLPVLTGSRLDWSLAAAQAAFPSLLGHLMFGALTGLALGVMTQPPTLSRARLRVVGGSLLRGVVGGAVALPVLANAVPGGFVFPLALFMGLGFAVLYPRSPDGGGPTLVRGACFGFMLWVAIGLTAAPALGGEGPVTSVAQVREAFSTFPGYVLGGAVTALVHHWLGGLGRLLFAEPSERDDEDEGPGARGLHALANGAIGGLLGALLFHVVMRGTSFTAVLATLVGLRSPLVGAAIHLAIGAVIGASFGLSFRRQTYDLGSALGWGVAYGFVWWIAGALTLLPLLLGGQPAWAAPEVTAAFPALIGHLGYGAVVGTTFYLLQARSSPWWLTRTEAEAHRIARHRASLQGAPAVWALVVVIVMTVPMVLATPGS